MNEQERKEKFTPGPWRVRKIAEFLFVLANDDGIIKMGKDAKEVASMPNFHHYPDEVKTIYANAHLIAAAPDMYYALKDLMDVLDFALSNAERVPDCIVAVAQDAMEKAEAAQKKARGEE